MFRLTSGLLICLAAQPALADQVTTFTLSNGMQAVVIEDHRAPVVTHMVIPRVLSRGTSPAAQRAHFAAILGAAPDLPAVIYNNEVPGLDKKEVRWALTLAIDIVRVAMASYRGAAT